MGPRVSKKTPRERMECDMETTIYGFGLRADWQQHVVATRAVLMLAGHYRSRSSDEELYVVECLSQLHRLFK